MQALNSQAAKKLEIPLSELRQTMQGISLLLLHRASTAVIIDAAVSVDMHDGIYTN